MPEPPKLLDRVRAAIRARHYSRRTEEAYVSWIRRYILFHGKRHPSAMGVEEVNAFLTALATDGKVAALLRGPMCGKRRRKATTWATICALVR